MPASSPLQLVGSQTVDNTRKGLQVMGSTRRSRKQKNSPLKSPLELPEATESRFDDSVVAVDPAPPLLEALETLATAELELDSCLQSASTWPASNRELPDASGEDGAEENGSTSTESPDASVPHDAPWKDHQAQNFDTRLRHLEQQLAHMQAALNHIVLAGNGTTLQNSDPMDEPETRDNPASLSPSAGFVGDWQTERERLLNSWEAEENPPAETRTLVHRKPLIERTLPELEAIPGVSPDDLHEIAALKQKLQEMLRESEVELSIQRAKISQERAQLEQKAAVLSQRERELSRRAEESKRPKGVLGRMKNFLTHRATDPNV